MLSTIQFSRSTKSKNEEAYLKRVMDSRHLHGDGEFTFRVKALLESMYENYEVLLTTSCTDALEMTAILSGIKPGDEVIVPSFTFPSSASAFASRGAKIVFCDISPTNFNICTESLEALITNKTKAIVTVNYAGIACDYGRINSIVDGRSITIIEDNAQGIYVSCKDKKLGTFGDLSTMSFHNTKNISCGEGGAIFIPKDNQTLISKAKIIREKGTNRELFISGKVDKYTWVDIGSSFLMSDINAAVLLASLEDVEIKTFRRLQVWNQYLKAAKALGSTSLQLPLYMNDFDHNAHIFPILAENELKRTKYFKIANDMNISIASHYEPLSISPAAIANGFSSSCPISEDVSKRMFRLPLHDGMTSEDISRVVDFIGMLK